MRPLDFLGRIKVKLGIVIVLAVVAAFVVNEVGINAGLSRDLRIAIAVVLALIMVQLLAHGMTRPLREMAAAAQTIAKGRYGLRVTATSRDEVGELARAFNAMAADLAEVDRQRRELVANVSHELRTPITGLQAVLENVVDGVTPPDLDTLGTALAQTQRLGRLVAQLLDLSRLDSGARLIEPEALDLASLCRQAVSEASLARTDVAVVSAVAPGTVLSADAALLAQVLANLLDNAVRHSPPGGAVRVEARPAGANLEISVTDDGPGIPVGARTRVFERFSRLDAGRAADAGGAGLGLAIAKEIVELHGGSIAVADPLPSPPAGRPADRDDRGPDQRTDQRVDQRVDHGTDHRVESGPGTNRGCRMVVVLPREEKEAAGEIEAGSGGGEEGRDGAHARQESAGRPDAAHPRAGRAPDQALPARTARTVPTTRGIRPPGDPTTDRAPAAGRTGIQRARHAGQTAGARADDGAKTASGVRRAEGPVGAVGAAGAGNPEGAGGTGGSEGAVGAVGAVGAGGPGGAVGAGGTVGMRAAQVPGDARSGNQRIHRPGITVPVLSALGAGAGLFGGFLAGLFAAFFLGILGGSALAVVALVGFAAGGAVAGAALGSSLARRSAPAKAPPPPRHPHEPLPTPSVSGPSVSGPSVSGPSVSGSSAFGSSAFGVSGYVPPPLLPRPELPDAPPWVLPAAAVNGLVAAVALPYAPTGLGLALTAVAMGAVAFPAVLPLRRGRITPWTVVFGLMAYALVSVALFRDADWLVAPVLLAAFGMGSLALSGGGRGWLAVIRGGVAVAFAVLPLPWFLAGPVRRLARRRRVLPTLVSAVVTVVLLAVFGLLFSSADAVFSAFVRDLLQTPEWAWSLPYRIFVFGVFAVLAAAAVLVGLRPVAEPRGPDLRMSLGRQVWVVPLLGLNLLFAAFVTVQITVLFGGSRRVLSTAGLTYAEYARSGFFELVTVSLFVLGVVAGSVALLRRESRADRWLLAALLGLLCGFTLVVLASALHRLGLYTDAYGLSRLRASVGATVWWLAAVFVLIPVAGAVRLFGGGVSWFFRALALLTGLSLLVFAAWDPDARVAETQLTVRGVERLDHGYLSGLGAEAVPVLDRLPEPHRSCVLRDVVAVNRLDRPDPWNGWNLARVRAREVLERRPVVQSGHCPGSYRVFRLAD